MSKLMENLSKVLLFVAFTLLYSVIFTPTIGSSEKGEEEIRSVVQIKSKYIPSSKESLHNSHVLLKKRLGNAIPLCKRDKDCVELATLIVFESRGEPIEGQVAVAHVVLNRVKHPKHWANNLYGVVHQPHQYSYHKDKHLQSSPTRGDWDKAYTVAYRALQGYSVSPVGNANHYHTVNVSPSWAKRLKRVGRIGNHVFYDFKNTTL